jgi:hypothetical protein
MAAIASSRTLRFWTLAGIGAVLAIAACVAVVVVATGRGGTPRAIGLKDVPVPAGTRVMTKVRSCDRGANPYCSLQVVLVGSAGQTSTALRSAYAKELLKLGWTTTKGPDGNETAADSRGHQLRLTFATAFEDLQGIENNWIQRTAEISHSLSDTMFDRAPALSIMLLRGSS